MSAATAAHLLVNICIWIYGTSRSVRLTRSRRKKDAGGNFPAAVGFADLVNTGLHVKGNQMIVTIVLSLVFLVVDFILSLLGTIPSFPVGFLDSIISYLSMVIDYGSGLFFFVIRPATFFVAIDILAFIWFAEPLYHFVMWVLRKVPFINVE